MGRDFQTIRQAEALFFVDECVVKDAVAKILRIAKLGLRHSVLVRLPGSEQFLKIDARIVERSKAKPIAVRQEEEQRDA